MFSSYLFLFRCCAATVFPPKLFFDERGWRRKEEIDQRHSNQSSVGQGAGVQVPDEEKSGTDAQEISQGKFRYVLIHN